MSISTSDRGRVLIVDDDRKILDLLVDLLELEGYEVLTAPTARKLSIWPYRLILTSWSATS